MVQTVKNTLRTCVEEREDQCLWILSYRTTPCSWPSIKVTCRVNQQQKISNQLHKEPSPPLLTEIKSNKAFISDRNNRRRTTKDHHYHHYTTVNTSACMTCALRHGSQEQSRDRLVHLNPTQFYQVQLEACTTAQDPNTNLIPHLATMHKRCQWITLRLVTWREVNLGNQWYWSMM